MAIQALFAYRRGDSAINDDGSATRNAVGDSEYDHGTPAILNVINARALYVLEVGLPVTAITKSE
jgi:hypothetical protein